MLERSDLVQLFLFTFACAFFVLDAHSDNVFIDRMLISNSATELLITNPSTQNQSNAIMRGESNTDQITSKDKIIYYTANIMVINPTKKLYNIKIICVDSKGNVIFRGRAIRSLSEFSYHIGHDIVKGYEQTLGLDPMPGAMVKGQISALINGENYYIKLFFEDKLIGLTKFNYIVIP